MIYKTCSAPGCHRVVVRGKCELHAAKAQAREQARKAQHDATRPSSTQRGYDPAWSAVRRQYLAAHPDCVGYGAQAGRCHAKAAEVDHIRSVREAPELRLNWGNLRGLCRRCHSARTAKEQAFGRGGQWRR